MSEIDVSEESMSTHLHFSWLLWASSHRKDGIDEREVPYGKNLNTWAGCVAKRVQNARAHCAVSLERPGRSNGVLQRLFQGAQKEI
jgi:hypothetical protein